MGEELRWEQFAGSAPRLAVAGAELLRQFTVGYLATVRGDGMPRVHPVSVALADGGLFIFVLAHTPKLADLRRDGRYALHSFPRLPTEDQWDDEEFMIGGRAVPVLDPAMRKHVSAAHNDAVAPGSELFELRIGRAVHKHREHGMAIWTTWTAMAGVNRRRPPG